MSNNTLQEALTEVRQQESQMRRCLEHKGKIMDAVKHASTLLAELRSSTLPPKQYYELYIVVFDALAYLGAFLKDSHPQHHLADLYELVQYAGNIVPRLYLMITVGTVYMGMDDAPVKEIMKDMMEMCRGVQHPVRGLFLRYYLSQRSRDKLPTLPEGDENAATKGSLQDSIQFVITNFIEMNKLWVRLQHQGHSRERDKRTAERQELQILVGSNLVRLSQLEGIDKTYYREAILPAILEQVVQCRDILAQEYLLDVITQVFPDDFHLATLDIFLDTIANLNPGVSVRRIVITMIERLAAYAAREAENETNTVAKQLKEAHLDGTKEEEEADKGKDKEDGDEKDPLTAAAESPYTEEYHRGIPASMDLFKVFWDHFLGLLKVRPDLPLEDQMAILGALTKLSMNAYPERLEFLDQIFSHAAEKLKAADSASTSSKETVDALLAMVLAPINYYSRLLTVLSVPSYLELLQSQTAASQRVVAIAVIDSVLKEQAHITDIGDAEGVFGLLQILIVPRGAAAQSEDEESEDVAADQAKIAKVVHLLYHKDPDSHYKLLVVARKALSAGGQLRKYTYPALVFSTLRIARRYKARESVFVDWMQRTTALFKFIHKLISDVSITGRAEYALRLYVDAAQVADQCGAEEAAYEFFVQAFTVYEEAVSDSRAQFQAICIFISALQQTRNFSLDNYKLLISKTAVYGSKLLKKPDQCRAVYMASHLWWTVDEDDDEEDEAKEPVVAEEDESGSASVRDGKRVLECLQRALRVADACMDVAVQVQLFVEILNRYIYYFDHGNSEITVKYINGLVEVIQNNFNDDGAYDAQNIEAPKKYFDRTLDYIASQKEVDERYESIVW
ncbi:Vacuolar protein sorting-associated protein 35 [Yarrowia sp. C11]|nr:Vacuolar protein sorting-associated protein 35 [Yarrowia sp. C11]KAG5370841.1 Vacuolar protein sorting-associated protein 35 [Yarrowia sp. E02]